MKSKSSPLQRYLSATGLDRDQVITKCRTADMVKLRSALIYLTWKQRENERTEKSKTLILREIGEEFDLSRVSVHDRIVKFEFELNKYRDIQCYLDELKSSISDN